MPDLATNLLLSVAVFAGAFVSCLCLQPCRLRILRGRGRDPAADFPVDGGGAADVGLQYRCAGRQWWTLRRNIQWEGSLLLIGVGLVGGLTAMPGAIPDHLVRHARPAEERPARAGALAPLLERQSLSSKLVIDLAISLPALFAGSVLGIVAFRNINEVGFRRTILVLLLLSGAS